MVKPDWEQQKEEQMDEFVEHLRDIDEITSVYAGPPIDFTIGELDVWPRYSNDDHLNAVRSSSVSTSVFNVRATEEERFIHTLKIHLPPAPASLRSELEDGLALGDENRLYGGESPVWCLFGTMMMGTPMPPPDGTVTPHLTNEGARSITFAEAMDAVDMAVEVYRNVYDSGAKAIKQQPDLSELDD